MSLASIVERLVVQCPYYGGSTIGGSTVTVVVSTCTCRVYSNNHKTDLLIFNRLRLVVLL